MPTRKVAVIAIGGNSLILSRGRPDRTGSLQGPCASPESISWSLVGVRDISGRHLWKWPAGGLPAVAERSRARHVRAARPAAGDLRGGHAGRHWVPDSADAEERVPPARPVRGFHRRADAGGRGQGRSRFPESHEARGRSHPPERAEFLRRENPSWVLREDAGRTASGVTYPLHALWRSSRRPG